MDFKQIVVIGAGLIGGSFAMSLKACGFKGKIVGIDRREENLHIAKEKGIIDEYSTFPSKGVNGSDLILLSTPAGQFLKIIEEIAPVIKRGAIVTDVGSVKGALVRRLEELMPAGVSFVGGHPIAGKELSGIETASAHLFKGKMCVITPTQKTDRNALKKVMSLWQSLGSNIVTMSPEEHDRIFGAVSHLPHVVAYALVNTVIGLDKNILPYSGQGFRDITRIALSPPDLWGDVCRYNAENILSFIDSFESAISLIKDKIKNSQWEALEEEFKKAQTARSNLGTD